MREGLLRTIAVPNNLANLGPKLPKSNYSVQGTRPPKTINTDGSRNGVHSFVNSKNLSQIKSMKDIQSPKAAINIRASQNVPILKNDLLTPNPSHYNLPPQVP